jgi:Co/Zn/Cd efflux system component
LNIAFFSFVIFCIFETVFALIANSQSMLADAQAMSIDAMSYLFNMGAEYLKKKPLSSKQESLCCFLTPQEQRRERELRRLYLELIPPTISVIVLISVTIQTLVQAFESLMGHTKDISGGDKDDDEDDVSVALMFGFSAANLVLDILNVTCFARAKANYGLGGRSGAVVEEQDEEGSLCSSIVDEEEATSEATTIITTTTTTTSGFSHNYGAIDNASISSTKDESFCSQTDDENDDDDTMTRTTLQPQQQKQVNLNMCSAWTHVCADTMRTIAVLIAASIAMLFPEQVDGKTADAVAAVAVSIIILLSLASLIQGLVMTAISIRQLHSYSCSRNKHNTTAQPSKRRLQHAMIIKEIIMV